MREESHHYLFSGSDWALIEKVRKQELQSEIHSIPENQLLNASIDDLCDYFEKKFKFETPILHKDRILSDYGDIQLDVSQHELYDIRDRNVPFYVTGTRVRVFVPFSGNPQAFQVKPTRRTIPLPRGEIRGSEIIIKIQGKDLNPQQAKIEFESMIGKIEVNLGWLNDNICEFNDEIRQLAKQQIDSRRTKLLADKELVEYLGFPLKERSSKVQTFTAPNVRRRIAPKFPSASSDPYKPEPALSTDDYEHILSVISYMAFVMERSPSAFSTMDEETLRSHILVQLNGHYEGQATGETFNYEGKTDILIRADGKNIFIAECKFWNGAKKFRTSIDQLLGYLSWRDTKTAILLFNRKQKFFKSFTRYSKCDPETQAI